MGRRGPRSRNGCTKVNGCTKAEGCTNVKWCTKVNGETKAEGHEDEVGARRRSESVLGGLRTQDGGSDDMESGVFVFYEGRGPRVRGGAVDKICHR